MCHNRAMEFDFLYAPRIYRCKILDGLGVFKRNGMMFAYDRSIRPVNYAFGPIARAHRDMLCLFIINGELCWIRHGNDKKNNKFVLIDHWFPYCYHELVHKQFANAMVVDINELAAPMMLGTP